MDTRADDTGYAEFTQGYRLILPMITCAELRQGSLTGGWGDVKVQSNGAFLRRNMAILPVTETTAQQWASLRFECRRRGIGNTENDAWVAAAALEMNLPLVSNDRDSSADANRRSAAAGVILADGLTPSRRPCVGFR